ncbi:MAG: hypothetical protein JXA49_00405, partial [Actinobacteria bacterium]|nr:hypothetical protein [Actinomycetota bacterium]
CNPPFTYETIDQIWKFAEPLVLELRKEWMGRDAIMKQELDNIYCSLDEHGHFGHIETIFQADYDEPKNEALGVEIKGIAEGWKNNINGTYMSLPADAKAALTWIDYMKKIINMLDETGKNDSWERLLSSVMNPIEDVKLIEE